jgi:glycerate 2-kinase
MNILIAPDKFKGTLTAPAVCDAIESGLNKAGVDASIRKFPLADGGEGTLDVFCWHTQGSWIEVEVHDPLMRKIKSAYAISEDGRTAFIEMARASGLGLLKPFEYDPLKTSTFGTGELIRDALERKVKTIIMAIGGSATNDAALGAAVALGAQVFDSTGNDLFPRGGTLQFINSIELSHFHPQLSQVDIKAICDVSNPFYGEQGAAFVYGPQKGATPESALTLDKGLRHVAEIVHQQFGIDLQQIPGAGAGGGFAGGAYAFFNATMMPGTEVVFELTHFDEALQWADVVITGEGKLDNQTLRGKLVKGVADRAFTTGKKVIVVCGENALTDEKLKAMGILYTYSLIDYAGKEESLAYSMKVVEEVSRNRLAEVLKK